MRPLTDQPAAAQVTGGKALGAKIFPARKKDGAHRQFDPAAITFLMHTTAPPDRRERQVRFGMAY